METMRYIFDMAHLLETSEIQARLAKIPEWGRKDKEIFRKFTFKNFAEALRFVNRVGEAAEAMDHHPDILLHGYKQVTLTLTTHSAGGLTRMDFDLAERIDRL